MTIAILAASLILIAVKRPYIESKDNARAFANCVVSIMIIAVYVALTGQTDKSTDLLQSSIYVPYAIIVLLLFMTLTSLVFIIARLALKIREMREERAKHKTANLFTTESLDGSNVGEAKLPPEASIEHTKQGKAGMGDNGEPEEEF